jgi:Flp pilus assembly protein TadD, contains TPR repeats
MSTKKETSSQLSSAENALVTNLLANYQQFAQRLHETEGSEQVETVLTDIFQAPVAIQIAFVKALGRENRNAAADVASALNALSPEKEVRKEARRSLIRLESSKTYPKWKVPATQTALAQVPVANPPRFWKGYASPTRETGEVILVLCWELGHDYKEANMLAFGLDFWELGIKDFITQSGTKRQIDERIRELHSDGSVLQLSSCTLPEGKRLLQEALDVNAWRKADLNKDFRFQLPTIKRYVLDVEDVGLDSERTFVTTDMEVQELVVNFIGGWAFGDFGLAYDLLSKDSPLRQKQSRDEWIAQHRVWYDEAKPTRMKLDFVHEQGPTIWEPTKYKADKKTHYLETGWSLELNATQLSGTLEEMPMGTAVNKETSRHWFWTSYTLVKEDESWFIQQVTDEGAALQGLSVEELQQRIKSYEDAIDRDLEHRDDDPEAFREETAWRLSQLLHFDDALLKQVSDYDTYRQAYEHALLTGEPERMVVYLDLINQRFPAMKTDTLRRLGSTLAEMAYHSDEGEMKERHAQLIQQAEKTLREVVSIEDSALNRSLLAELLMSEQRDEEAHSEFLKASEQLPTKDADVPLHASIEAGLGNVAMRAQHYAEALPHYEKVAELNPHYPGVWFSLGFANRLSNNMDDAETYYAQGLAIEPIDPRIYSELTAIYVKRKEYSRAQTLIENALKRNTETAYLHMLLASVFSESGDKQQAQEHIEEAERLDPNSDIIAAVHRTINGKQA